MVNAPRSQAAPRRPPRRSHSTRRAPEARGLERRGGLKSEACDMASRARRSGEERARLEIDLDVAIDLRRLAAEERRDGALDALLDHVHEPLPFVVTAHHHAEVALAHADALDELEAFELRVALECLAGEGIVVVGGSHL